MCVRSIEYWRAMTPSDQVGAKPIPHGGSCPLLPRFPSVVERELRPDDGEMECACRLCSLRMAD
jgi:hypothetical protein